jgi:hypothetical protein
MKSKTLSTLARVAAATLVLSFATSAHAGIIDLNAGTSGGGPNDIGNVITIPGLSTSDILSILQIGVADGGAYNAWNAWGSVTGCDGAGENCSKGWINNWSYYLNGDTSTQMLVSDGIRYETDLFALANAPGVAPITGITSISFFLGDSPYSDNIGGISLNVYIEPGASVPEPSIIALFGLGLLGLGFARRRKA